MPNQLPRLRKRQVDLLLLSIIRAHKHHGTANEQERLDLAKEALFGHKRGRGRKYSSDDFALFQVLAETRKRDTDSLRMALAKLNSKPVTPEWTKEVERDPQTMREAARRFSGLAGVSANVTATAVEDRLRRKAREGLSDKDMADIESLLDPSAPLTRNIVRILELLEGLGVPSETIWDINP
jgi:hypothetical protein